MLAPLATIGSPAAELWRQTATGRSELTPAEVNTSSPRHRRPVTRPEVAEVAIAGAAILVLTALGTWLARWVGIPVGWRLAAGAGAAIAIVGGARLAYYRQRPGWRWWGALVALWLMIVLTNLAAEVRLW